MTHLLAQGIKYNENALTAAAEERGFLGQVTAPRVFRAVTSISIQSGHIHFKPCRISAILLSLLSVISNRQCSRLDNLFVASRMQRRHRVLRALDGASLGRKVTSV